jgi:hypothetical protein
MSCIYLIKEGEVNYFKNKRLSKTYKRKDYLGEEALFEGHRNTYDIVAKTDCIIFSISIDFFHNFFGKGKDFKDQLYFSSLKMAFLKSTNFNSLSPFLLNKIFNSFNFKTFKKNNVIYRKGTDISKKICVILEGSIIEKGTNKIQGEKNDILFEQKLSKENEYKINNDLFCDSNCLIAEANYEDIKNALGLKTTIKKKEYNISPSNKKSAIKLNPLKNDDDNINNNTINNSSFMDKNYSNKYIYTDSKKGQFSTINTSYFSPSIKNSKNHYRGSIQNLKNYSNNIYNFTSYIKSPKKLNNNSIKRYNVTNYIKSPKNLNNNSINRYNVTSYKSPKNINNNSINRYNISSYIKSSKDLNNNSFNKHNISSYIKSPKNLNNNSIKRYNVSSYIKSSKDLNNNSFNKHNASSYIKSFKDLNNYTNKKVSNFKKVHDLRRNFSDENLSYSNMTVDNNNNRKGIAMRTNFSLKKLNLSNLKKNNEYLNNLSEVKSDRNFANYAKNLKITNYIKNVKKPYGDVDKISIFKSLNDQKKEIVQKN